MSRAMDMPRSHHNPKDNPTNFHPQSGGLSVRYACVGKFQRHFRSPVASLVMNLGYGQKITLKHDPLTGPADPVTLQ